jgi:hypothetical protein
MVDLKEKTIKDVKAIYNKFPYDDPTKDDPKGYKIEFTDGTAIDISGYNDSWGDTRINIDVSE